ncbi:hypothetical protein PHMEG_0004074 [Phytophthora megakarya]|uniref:Uncharacterized protein n=1 Tax=Phytophthora megakarya TaxID=4795 RepID=A0A225WWD4_9STRA|nr:hypothetical protein PHMEG_0004074 [Phytophthora megakarya]
MTASTLATWSLHDCSGFVEPRRNAEMVELFERCRAIRSKPVTKTWTVTMKSLDRAWTAFVERWNKETGAEFVRTLDTEGGNTDPSRMDIDVGVRRVSRYRVRKSGETSSQRFRSLTPRSPRSLRTKRHFMKLGAAPLGDAPRSGRRSPAGQPRGPNMVRSYPALDQANAPDIAGDLEIGRHGEERRGSLRPTRRAARSASFCTVSSTICRICSARSTRCAGPSRWYGA